MHESPIRNLGTPEDDNDASAKREEQSAPLRGKRAFRNRSEAETEEHWGTTNMPTSLNP